MIECARTLMMEKNVALKYCREAVSAIVYTLNRVQIKKGTNATPFELWYGHSTNVKHFKVFGCKRYILKEFRNEKFDAKSDEGIFLGYSTTSKSYTCLYVNTKKVVESANVKNLMSMQKCKTMNPPRNQRNTSPLYTSMKECLMKKMFPIKMGINNKLQYLLSHSQ